MEHATTTRHPIPVGKIVFGLALVVVGIIGFLHGIDVWSPRVLHLWPLVLIAIGIASEIDALRERRSDGGAVLVAIGVWFFVGTQGFFDLGIREALPIGIAVWGALFTLHAFVDRPKSVAASRDRADVLPRSEAGGFRQTAQPAVAAQENSHERN